MLYWSKIAIPDPFIAFEINGQKIAVVNSLELENMKKNSAFHDIINIDEVLCKNRDPAEIIKTLGAKYDVDKWSVPYDFPAGLWVKLKSEGTRLSFCEQERFIEERTIKSSEEIRYIKEACEITAKALDVAQSIIADSMPDNNNILIFKGNMLTSNQLRREIEIVCAKNGAVAKNTIVSCGKHSAQPHNPGKGPLFANQFIVIDIFPKVMTTGYHGDMTRTFIKGTPSHSQIQMYNAVKKAQTDSIKNAKAGASCKYIHNNNLKLFASLEFHTDYAKSEGFFHSTGHGLGLDVHEFPGIGNLDVALQNNMVVTIEPGLYYRDIGGVRLEDVIVIKEFNCEMLSNFNYDWIL
jgi:Xaa-Pro aminopeptidase